MKVETDEEAFDIEEALDSIFGDEPSQGAAADLLVCPVCGHDDKLLKVSAVVAAGTSTQEMSGTSTAIGGTTDGQIIGFGVGHSLSGISVSSIAAKLYPPARPSNRVGCGGPIVAVIVIWVVLLFANRDTSDEAAMRLLVTITIVSVGLPLLYWAAARHRKQEQYEALAPVWQKAIERWNRLYYCQRDDVVFDPRDGVHASSDRMNQLLLE